MKKLLILVLFLLKMAFFLAQSDTLLYNQGVALLDTKKYTEAIKMFTKTIAVNSKFERAYYQRAWCYFKTNNSKKAMVDYDSCFRVCKIKEDLSSIFNSRGDVYFKDKKEKLAVE